MPERTPHSDVDPGADADRPRETVIQDPVAPAEHDDRVDALVESDAPAEEVARHVEELDAPDAADTLERLEPEESVEVIERMEDEAAAEALSHMQIPIALTLFADFSIEESSRYLALMEPDDAADFLQELPKDRARTLLQRLPAELGRLVQYDPETAGGLMTTEFVSIGASQTVADATEQIRSRRDEIIKDFIYCTGNDGTLEGVIALRDLLLAEPDDRVADLLVEQTEVGVFQARPVTYYEATPALIGVMQHA